MAFDTTSLLGRSTGIGASARQLLRRLAVEPSLEIVPYALTWRGRGGLDAALAEAGWTAPTGGDRAGRGLARRLHLPLAARPLRALWRRVDAPPIEWWTGPVDVVWSPNFVVPPTQRAAAVVTVHDLTPVRFPELCQADTLAYPDLIRRAVARGATVQTTTHAVAAEVRQWLGLPAERVVTVPLGVDATAGSHGDAAAGRRRAGADRYILALGTVEPRKDLPTLVAGFDRAAAKMPGVALVVVGPDGWGVEAFQAALDAAHHRSRIHRLGWVDDRTRADLLAGAGCLAFPSVYEGFGLPPLEAMAAGVPVVCSDIAVLAEVTGDAALRVPPGDVDAWAEGLRHVDADEALRADLVRRGHERVGQFTWEASAAGMATVLRGAARAAL